MDNPLTKARKEPTLDDDVMQHIINVVKFIQELSGWSEEMMNPSSAGGWYSRDALSLKLDLDTVQRWRL